jgi:hypothetical protein
MVPNAALPDFTACAISGRWRASHSVFVPLK